MTSFCFSFLLSFFFLNPLPSHSSLIFYYLFMLLFCYVCAVEAVGGAAGGRVAMLAGMGSVRPAAAGRLEGRPVEGRPAAGAAAPGMGKLNALAWLVAGAAAAAAAGGPALLASAGAGLGLGAALSGLLASSAGVRARIWRGCEPVGVCELCHDLSSRDGCGVVCCSSFFFLYFFWERRNYEKINK